MKILSVDVESNGLHGQPFAIGAMLTDDDGVHSLFEDSCIIDGPVDPWVAENVLPALGTPVPYRGTGHDYPAMLAQFAGWFDRHKAGAVVIAHCGVPVEARLFADMVRVLGRDPFSGPFPLHDLATLLYAVGADPLSADGYRTAHGLRMAAAYEAMSPHNPLYDAAVAEACWRHLTTSRVERTHYGPLGCAARDVQRRTEYAYVGPWQPLAGAEAEAWAKANPDIELGGLGRLVTGRTKTVGNGGTAMEEIQWTE